MMKEETVTTANKKSSKAASGKPPGKKSNRASGKKAASSKPYCYDYPRPSVTVDVVLLYRDGARTEALLIKRGRAPFKGAWALPGGFVDQDESLEQAAVRELKEETGLDGIRLEQLGAFGDPGRDPRGHTVSVVFVAQLDSRAEAAGADDATEARWHSASRPPRLAFDHKKILRQALAYVSSAQTVSAKEK
jgi:8-oxo-dGTP diphosphatase